MSVVVMKFGGASVANPESFSRIADIISGKKQEGKKVVVVVSAMEGTTNQLISLAERVNPDPPKREYDMLISVGERISISLLAMALAAKQIDAISFTGSQSGIITCKKHSDAHIIDVRPQRILGCLDEGKIVIVAGFQGVSTDREITTLGRGGSDTTAVALGIALNAEIVEFYKDVPGVFDVDPKLNSSAKHYDQMSYSDVEEIVSRGAKILHHRCIKLAEKNHLPLLVCSFKNDNQWRMGTLITNGQSRKQEDPIFETIDSMEKAEQRMLT